MAQQRIYFWLASAEIDKCVKRGVFSANCKDEAAEFLPGLCIENSFIFKAVKGIAGQNLGPFIGVVAGCVAACKKYG